MNEVLRYKIRKANLFEDHDDLLWIAKQSPYTNSFGHIMFSSQAAYDKGWIRVAESESTGILGFTCVRHKVRAPETVIYFIGVQQEWRQLSIGTALLEDIYEQTPHKTIALNCAKANTGAVYFWQMHGFEITGESLKGKGWAMEKKL